MMQAMKRTTIFLPEDLHERLRQEAFRARVSMAELIRSRLQGGRTGRRRRVNPLRDPILEVAGIISDGTLNQNLDEELYEI
jgi:hypothetical protein